VLPLATLFVLLGGLRMKAHWASLIALAVALAVATIAYPMPVGQALDAALLGAVFGLFPIMWIVVNAIWLYNMTTKTGHFEVLRRSFGAVSPDQRVQAIVIAFSFGALLEALAGFGTPVAITAVMLIALGFKPVKAASVALVANTAPVAFGALAIPIITLAEVTGLPQEDLGAMVGRQTPFLAVIVPLILVGMVDRPARAAPGLAARRGRRAQLRARPVRRVELLLGRARRRRRRAGLRGRDHRAATRMVAQRAADRRGLGRRAPGGGGRRGPRSEARGRGPPPRGRRRRLAARRRGRLRAVPDPDRRLLDRPDRARERRPQLGHRGVPLAGAERRRLERSKRRTRRPSPSTGSRARARSC
jgi:L-lactate permease